MPNTTRNKRNAQLQLYRYPSTLRRSPSMISNSYSPMQLQPGTLPQFNSELSSTLSPFRKTLPSFLQSVQKLLSQLLADPELTQTRVFQYLAPIAVFLSLVTATAISPRTGIDVSYSNNTQVGKAMFLDRFGFLCLMAVIIILGTLIILRALIWLCSLCVRRFMEVDFGTGRGTSAGILDNVIGGLFTS